MKYVIIVASVFLSACGSNSTSAASSDEPGAVPGANAEASMIPLGKPGAGKDVVVTVLSVKQKSQIGEPRLGPKAEPGETFVVVRYTIKNTDTKPLDTANRPELALLDGGGQTYSEDTTAGVLAAALNNDIQDATGDLNPNVTAKSTAVWKIDKASFDKKTWRIVGTFGGLGAKLDKAASWPMNPDAEQPLTFALQ